MNETKKLYVIGFLLASLMVMAFTFYQAFYNGLIIGNFMVTIDINNYHEAWLEALLFPIITGLGIKLFIEQTKKIGVKNESV